MTGPFAAVVPVLDEASAIADVVGGLRAVGACCVIVVDGGSRDGSRARAADAGAVVVAEPRRGYGRACLTGAAYALAAGAAHAPAPMPATAAPGHRHAAVAFLDGDGSCDPADAGRLVAALDRADIALGRRTANRVEPGSLPRHAALGNALVAAVVSARTGRRIADLSPLKAARAAALERLALDAEGYGWTVQFVARSLAARDLRVRELEVGFRVRRGGVSKVSGSVRASLAAGVAMTRAALAETRSRPLVALMAKAPRAGHAKTRLAAAFGDDRTAEFWTASLADSAANALAAARATGSVPVVMLPDADDVGPVVEIVGPCLERIVQARPGLPAALERVFLEAHDRGADRAIAVAGDAPSLPPDELVAAMRGLERDRSAAVIGPSLDGGYHLIGLRWQPAPRWLPRTVRERARARLADRLRPVFAPAAGGPDVAASTSAALAASGWRPVRLTPWPDLDTVEDLRRAAETLASDGHVAPRTAAWLRRHRDVIVAASNRATSAVPTQSPVREESSP